MHRTACLVVLILLGTSLSGCISDTEELGESTPDAARDLAPVLTIWPRSYNYGDNVVLSGQIIDESVASTIITLRVLIADASATMVEEFEFTPSSQSWTVASTIETPRDYEILGWAEDEAGHRSQTVQTTLNITAPVELEPAIMINFLADENESGAGVLGGSIVHAYIETCTSIFQTDSGVEIVGSVNPVSAMYSIAIAPDTERNGSLIVSCGLFTLTSTTVAYLLPAFPPDEAENEEVDTDNDGIENELDQCAETPVGEQVSASGCSLSQLDSDADGINDSLDQCPNQAENLNGFEDDDGCEDVLPPAWSPIDSWLCQNAGVHPIYDLNDQYGYQANTADPFTCQIDVSFDESTGEMIVESNGIPNHDFTSTRGCCADEQDYTWTFPSQPVNDTDGQFEQAASRGAVAVAVNGVPIFGPEDGPGSDAVALHHRYYHEDRQQIELGICGGHSAGATYHYHWDANCIHWLPNAAEDISDYDWTSIDSSQHSGIIGWAFDGYPIYGIYGYDDQGDVVGIKSSYQLKADGEDGYEGISDWEYIAGMGDLDECNGRYGPTPEYPEGIYHYVSTPLSGSTDSHVDVDGNTVSMIGFPYFLLCYRGEATGGPKGGAGQGGPPGGPNSASSGYNAEAILEPAPTQIFLGYDMLVLLSLLALFAFSIKLVGVVRVEGLDIEFRDAVENRRRHSIASTTPAQENPIAESSPRDNH